MSQRTPDQEFARYIKLALVAFAICFIYFIIADIRMPMTPQARVYHQVTQISPQINGPINEVLVKNNQTVKEGQVLFVIDETPYLIALEKRTQPQTDIDAIASPTLVHIPCVGHQRILLLPESDIHFAYSDVAGVHVRSLEQQADTQLTLKTLEERTALVRCHRQYLVRLSCVAEIKLLDNGLATLLMKTGDSVPVSRRYLKKLKSLLTL